MSEDTQAIEQTRLRKFWFNHQITLLVIVTITIALVMVIVSMVLYNVSGTAQLDLSRPGYSGVSTQVDAERETFREYSATGSVNQESLEEFRELYEEQVASAKAIDAFGGDPMAPDALGIDESAVD